MMKIRQNIISLIEIASVGICIQQLTIVFLDILYKYILSRGMSRGFFELKGENNMSINRIFNLQQKNKDWRTMKGIAYRRLEESSVE